VAQFSRRDVLRILSGLILLTNPLAAEATTGPSLKCTRVGQRIIWRKESYTCVQSGKKLVWAKQSAKPSPQPTSVEPTQNPPAATSPRNVYTPPPEEFAVAKSVNLKLNQPISVSSPSFSNPSRGYILIRREDGVIAFSNNCTHLGREVEISGSQLVCYAHGSYFDTKTGKPTQGPATRNLITLPITERDGTIFVIDAP
jgi:nitrite reductase/ring-hydroxylating ferredoxin subunit